jgi:uncharacterized membrane protein HdeD (DUF308 family)
MITRYDLEPNMDNNPYAPPRTVVADIESPFDLPRPREVTGAVRLYWLALLVAVPSAIYDMFTTPVPGATLAMLVIIFGVIWALVLGLMYWIYSSIGKGRNWARILTTVLVVVGLLFSFWAVPVMFAQSTLSGITYLVQTALNVWATVLLYKEPANTWFRAMKGHS